MGDNDSTRHGCLPRHRTHQDLTQAFSATWCVVGKVLDPGIDFCSGNA
jgi:hypothetical protein